MVDYGGCSLCASSNALCLVSLHVILVSSVMLSVCKVEGDPWATSVDASHLPNPSGRANKNGEKCRFSFCFV